MARRQPACWSFCAMAQAMLRLLARPKITAVFCVSVTCSSRGDSVLYVQLLLIWRWPKWFSDAVEGFLDFFYGIAEDDRAAVGAAHGAIGFREGGEEPFHLCLVEWHVDFDGGVAGGGGGNFGLQRFDGDGGVFALDAVENFGEEFFGVAAGDACGRCLDRNAARAHRPDFEAVGAQLFGYFFVDGELPRRKLENHGHEHALAFDFS